MASQFEAGDAWTVRRLRSNELGWAHGINQLPSPVALATGPNDQANAGAVGAGEYWVLDTTLPKTDLCWVVVQGHPLFQDSNVTAPVQIYWYPQGNNSIGQALTGPAFGPGENLAWMTVASGGTHTTATVADVPRTDSVWLPLDPENTLAGVATTLIVKAGAAGPAAGNWRANLTGCRMLGFPTSAWYTGALWEPLVARGS